MTMKSTFLLFSPLPPGESHARARRPTFRPREFRLQSDVAKLLADHLLPDWRASHFPAGEKRDVITGAKLKRAGLKKGWPDFLLLSPVGRLHCLELKRQGEKLSDAQQDFWRWCVRAGVPHSTCRTIDEVLTVLDRWRCLRIRIGGAP